MSAELCILRSGNGEELGGQAEELILHNLGLSGSPGTSSETDWLFDHLTVHSAALRAALWARVMVDTEEDTEPRPVYVTRLLHDAHRLMPLSYRIPAAQSEERGRAWSEAPVLERPDRTLLRDALEELESVGDIASLPGGYWIPAPLRIVPLPNVARWLLIGGCPTPHIRATLTAGLAHVGVARLGNGMMDSLPSGFPIQSLGEWVRGPQDSLAGWTRQVIDQALHALEESPELEQVYAPGVAGISKSRGNLQYFRWAPGIQGLPDGRYLARGGSVGRVGGYQVIEVQRRQVTAARSVDFSGGDPRRLLYGLDAAAGWPTHVGVTRRGDDVVFRLENELPQAEHRLFTALGRLTLPPDGRYYPRRWTVPVALAPEARAALQRLGISLDEDVEREG